MKQLRGQFKCHTTTTQNNGTSGEAFITYHFATLSCLSGCHCVLGVLWGGHTSRLSNKSHLQDLTADNGCRGALYGLYNFSHMG